MNVFVNGPFVINSNEANSRTSVCLINFVGRIRIFS